MKKYLIVLAAAVVALASCNGGGAKYTSIKFKNSEVTLLPGEEQKLQVLHEPTTITDAPLCKWSSSDTSIVSVNENGLITALEVGEANVTATYGEGESALQAVCHVYVKMYEALWEPNAYDAFYFPDTQSDDPLNDSIYYYDYAKKGDHAIECRLYSVEVVIPNTIEFVGSEGSGDCVVVTAAVPFITKLPAGISSEYLNSPMGLGMNIVEDSATFKKDELSAFAGSIDPTITGPAFQALFEGYDSQNPDYEKFAADYEKGVSGAHITYIISEGETTSIYPNYDGIIKSGYIALDYDAKLEEYFTNYKFEAQWCYGGPVDGLYTGLKLNQQATSYSTLLLQPFEENLSGVWAYETGKEGVLKDAPAASAARSAMPVRHQATNRVIKRGKLVKFEVNPLRKQSDKLNFSKK